MKTVSNQELTIRVSEHGAELSSIVANATGKEYLWQADPAFWKRHSPVLFPIVGSVWKAEYRNEGTVYPLSQHGFARDMDFTLIDEAENELRFALERVHGWVVGRKDDHTLPEGRKTVAAVPARWVLTRI